jgi:hypothetical protein
MTLPFSVRCSDGGARTADYARAAISEYGDRCINFVQLVTQGFSHFQGFSIQVQKAVLIRSPRPRPLQRLDRSPPECERSPGRVRDEHGVFAAGGRT